MLNKNLQKPAYSLIYALVITTIIMIVATTAVQTTLGKLTYYNDVLSGVYAKYSAESAIDNALLAIKDAEAGYETSDTSSATSQYTVVSRAQHNVVGAVTSTEFYTPIPMTGTAAPSDECNYLAADDEDVDHACNWNKILYGDSVTIPLYSYDPLSSDTNHLSNPDELNLTEWNLKVRTPCSDGTYEDGCDRYELDEGSTYEEDGSIILWQLIGEDIDVNTVVSEVPSDDATPSRGSYIRTTTTNTEIYESLINDAQDYSSATKYNVLTTASPSTSDPDDTDLLEICNDSSIEKLYLQLSIVNPLIIYGSTTDESVPYLEWQLESSATSAFADNKAVVIGEGYYIGQSGTFYYPSVVTRTTVGERTATYTISN